MNNKTIILGIVFLALIKFSIAQSSTSTNYNTTIDITTGGNSSSTNYELTTTMPYLIGKSTSTNYNTSLGFLELTQNNPPNFTTIPNQTWDEDTILTINLSTYTTDIDGDNINYSSTSLENLTITINNQTKIATITPNSNWFGTENIIFTADDGYETINSSQLTLTVTDVAEPSVVTGGTSGPVSEKVGAGLIKDFEISLDQDLIKLRQEETALIELTIKNTGAHPLTISIENSLPELISQSRSLITVNPKEEQTTGLTIHTSTQTQPKVYIVNIKATSLENIVKTTTLILELESKEAIFDVKLDLDQESEIIQPGQPLISQITLLNLGDLKNIDVLLTYAILDLNNNIILEEKETLLIKDKLSFIKKFTPDLLTGNYVLTVSADYQDKTALASKRFLVVLKEKPGLIPKIIKPYYIYSAIALSIIIPILLYLNHKRLKKIKKIKTQPKKENTKKLNLIKKAYKQGFISEKIYKKSLKK